MALSWVSDLGTGIEETGDRSPGGCYQGLAKWLIPGRRSFKNSRCGVNEEVVANDLGVRDQFARRGEWRLVVAFYLVIIVDDPKLVVESNGLTATLPRRLTFPPRDSR
jgi:hypothetical protein